VTSVLHQGESTNGTSAGVIETDVPARLDRLPWSSLHRMVLIGLRTVWIALDVDAERRSLEDIASPVTAVAAGAGDAGVETLDRKTGPYPPPRRRSGSVGIGLPREQSVPAVRG
jgi:hypothetical protein